MKEPGRHPDDIYDDADQIRIIRIPVNHSEWFVCSEEVLIPEDIACILFRLGSKDISGQCHFGTPLMTYGSTSLKLLPFQPYRKEQKNWIGENLSSKEWPEFEISVNGSALFNGKIFDRASNVGDFEVDLPEPVSGKSVISIRLKEGFPARNPYAVKTVELLKTSARDFEIAAVPKFVNANKKFALLVEINQPGTKLKIKTSESISAVENEKIFDDKGLYPLIFNSGNAGMDQFINISDGKRETRNSISQIVQKNDDGIYRSMGLLILILKMDYGIQNQELTALADRGRNI